MPTDLSVHWMSSSKVADALTCFGSRPGEARGAVQPRRDPRRCFEIVAKCPICKPMHIIPTGGDTEDERAGEHRNDCKTVLKLRRDVVIVFDHDVGTKPAIQAAEATVGADTNAVPITTLGA